MNSGRGSWGSGQFRVFDRFPSLRGAALPRRPKPHYQNPVPLDLGISGMKNHKKAHEFLAYKTVLLVTQFKVGQNLI